MIVAGIIWLNCSRETSYRCRRRRTTRTVRAVLSARVRLRQNTLYFRFVCWAPPTSSPTRTRSGRRFFFRRVPLRDAAAIAAPATRRRSGATCWAIAGVNIWRWDKRWLLLFFSSINPKPEPITLNLKATLPHQRIHKYCHVSSSYR